MGVIARIQFPRGIALGKVWTQIREKKGKVFVEIWVDVFDPAIHWAAEVARAVLDEVGIGYRVTGEVNAEAIPVFFPAGLETPPEILPDGDSLRARILAGHGIAAALVSVASSANPPREEPTTPEDSLFYLSKPGGGRYCIWRLFRSKEDAVYHMQRSFPDDPGGAEWIEQVRGGDYTSLLVPQKKKA